MKFAGAGSGSGFGNVNGTGVGTGFPQIIPFSLVPRDKICGNPADCGIFSKRAFLTFFHFFIQLFYVILHADHVF
jgi:hypothetical protein